MDVESLQKSERRRGSCLDVFLVVSITFLFVAVSAVAVGGAMIVMELKSKLDTPRQAVEVVEVEAMKQTGEAPNPASTNFVSLDAASSELKTSTMPWASVSYGHDTSVGNNFLFDENQHSLRPLRKGSYFIYIDLNLTCTFNCNKGLLTVNVGDKLTCKVELPATADSTPVSKKCWTVSYLDDQGLVTQMVVPEEGLQNWKLELNSSKLGMFLVD